MSKQNCNNDQLEVTTVHCYCQYKSELIKGVAMVERISYWIIMPRYPGYCVTTMLASSREFSPYVETW